MTNFRLSNLDVNPFNNIHMNFSVMNKKNSEKIITGNDSEQKQIKNALHVLRQTSETNDISGDNSTKEASPASKVMLSASGILKQCLSEVLALKNKETVKNDEDIDFKDIDAEDLAVAYQKAQSSCAKEEDRAKLDEAYWNIANDSINSTVNAFSTAFGAIFDKLFTPTHTVKNPYQKEMLKSGFSAAALREQMTSFYSEALNSAKSSPAQNYSAETLQKISSAVSALGDDKANINKFTYKMIKSIKNAVKGLPDLTRLVNSKGVFCDVATAQKAVAKWKKAIGSLDKNIPEFIKKTLNFILQTFEKTWSFQVFTSESIDKMQDLDKTLQKKTHQYKQLQEQKARSQSLKPNERYELAKKMFELEKEIKELTKNSATVKNNFDGVCDSPGLIVGTNHYNLLNNIE